MYMYVVFMMEVRQPLSMLGNLYEMPKPILWSKKNVILRRLPAAHLQQNEHLDRTALMQRYYFISLQIRLEIPSSISHMVQISKYYFSEKKKRMLSASILNGTLRVNLFLAKKVGLSLHCTPLQEMT